MKSSRSRASAGARIFNLTASFHKPEQGPFEHQLPPREVPDPESLPTVSEEVRAHLGVLPEQVRVVRAVQALEKIGGPEAQAALRTLAEPEPESLTGGEARRALERLRR